MKSPIYPHHLADHLADHLASIAHHKAFLLWQRGPTKANGKFDKIPYYANGARRSGVQNSPQDLQNLVTLREALNILRRQPRFAGVGLALRKDLGLVVLDIDQCISGRTLKREFTALVTESYVEFSPSGYGLRIIVSGSVPEDYKNHPAGFEVFHSKGFVTLTGAKMGISPGKITALAAAPRIAGAIRKYSTAQGNSQNTPPGGADKDGAMLRMLDREQALSSIDEAVLSDIAAALGVLSSDAADDYHEWIKVGLALKSLEGEYPEEAHELWHSFSAKSGKYTPEDSESRWEGFSPSSISYRTIFSMADAVSRVWRKSQAGSAHNASIWEPIDYDLTRPVATDWLIKGIIPTGLGIFAGQPGAGKSSCLLPLALTVAGFKLRLSNLDIKYPRKVIMVTEAPQQMTLMLYAFCSEYDLDTALVKRMVTIIPGRRAAVDEIPNLGPLIESLMVKHDCPAGTVQLAPWVIFDTQNSSFDLQDENSNSEVGKLIGVIRTHLIHALKAPVAIVCHASKTTDRGTDQAWARGASAFVGDAEFTATFMHHESDMRFLHLNKVRFQPEARLIAFDGQTLQFDIPDIYGGSEATEVRISVPRKTSQMELRELEMEAKEQDRVEQDAEGLAALHKWLKEARCGKIPVIQISSGSPKLPEGLIADSVFRVSSEQLKKYRLSASGHASRLEAEYGWVKSGSYLLYYPHEKLKPAM